MKTILSLLAVVSLSSIASTDQVQSQKLAPAPQEGAGEDQASPTKDATIAFHALDAARESFQEETQAAHQEVRKAFEDLQRENRHGTDESRAKAQKTYDAKLTDYQKKRDEGKAVVEKAAKSFVSEFAKVEFSAWDSTNPGQASVMTEGLVLFAADRLDSRPEDAVRAYEYLIKVLPDSDTAKAHRARSLPVALLATGKFGDAAKRLSQLRNEVAENERATIDLHLGDAQALNAETKQAAKTYAEAIKALPKKLAVGDRRVTTKERLQQRTALVGKQAPPLRPSQSLGGDTKLSSHEGKVIVLEFWASWCPNSLALLPELHDFAKANEGITVIGASTPHRRGYLPKSLSELREERRDGTSYSGPTEAYADHLKDFRLNTGVAFPFALIKEDISEDYKLGNSLPVFVVIKQDGNVAFVGTGGVAWKQAKTLAKTLAK